MFACGTTACIEGARQAAAAVRAAGGEADIGYAAGAGRRSYGPFVDVMHAKMGWLDRDDPRFRLAAPG